MSVDVLQLCTDASDSLGSILWYHRTDAFLNASDFVQDNGFHIHQAPPVFLSDG